MIIENCSVKDVGQDLKGGLNQPYSKKIAQIQKEDTVYTFPKGLPAFEECREFSLMVNDNIKPFLYLKSLDNEGLGFICIDPFLVKKDYNVNLAAKDVSLLEIDNAEDAMILTLVTVNEDPMKTTTNLLAPVVINVDSKIGQQVILSESGNEVKFLIWSGLEA